MKEEKIFEQLEDFVDKNWFYYNEESDSKIVNANYLLDFIEWLKNNY